MTDLPPPVPLDQPAGSPDAVAEAAVSVRAAARDLEDLGQQVAAAVLPGWRGADADAAARRRAAVAGLAAELGEALHRAAARLTAHAELWTAVRTRIATLQAEQEADHARARPLAPAEVDLADLTGRSRAVALAWLPVEESRRAAEHGQLVARLAEDRAVTRAVLDACRAVVGGGWGGTDRVLLVLAGVLTGWGAPELGRRARALAESLEDVGGDPRAVDALVRPELPLAAHPSYALALLRALGRLGVLPAVLAATWTGSWTGTLVADLLGSVLSGLDRAAPVPDWLTGLLDDAVANGMYPGVVGGLAAALAAARRQGLAGPPPALAAAWAGRMLAVEASRALPEALRAAPPPGADPLTLDPVALVVDAVVRQGAAGEAAGLMSSPEAWASVLGRGWEDHGELVDRLVRAITEAPARAARQALHGALVTIGTGLEDSDPVDWPAQLLVVQRAAPALVTAVTRHVDDVRELLTAAAAGAADQAGATVLRGLSVVLAVAGGAEAAVADSLAAAAAHPAARGTAPVLPATAALAAVATHGRRLVAAMGEYRRKAESEAKGALWDITFGIPFALLAHVPAAGRVAGVLEAAVTRALGTNGLHSNEVQLPTDDDVRAGVRAFEATRDLLGEVRLPEETDPGLVRDLTAALVGDVAGRQAGRAVGRRPVLEEGVGEVVGGEVEDLVRGN